MQKKKEKRKKNAHHRIREKLIKADRSNVKSELFLFISDIVSSYIKNWKTIWFGRVDLDDCIEPCAIFNLKKRKHQIIRRDYQGKRVNYPYRPSKQGNPS